MKRFITDLYKFIYRVTGFKTLSVFLAVVYMSALNIMTLFGLIHLLKGLVSKITLLLTFFSFPVYIITIALMLIFNFWLLSPVKDLSKGKRVKPLIVPIIVYSFVALILFLYGRYFESINF